MGRQSVLWAPEQGQHRGLPPDALHTHRYLPTLLQIRWLMLKAGLGSSAAMPFVNIAFALVFFCCRNVWGPSESAPERRGGCVGGCRSAFALVFFGCRKLLWGPVSGGGADACESAWWPFLLVKGRQAGRQGVGGRQREPGNLCASPSQHPAWFQGCHCCIPPPPLARKRVPLVVSHPPQLPRASACPPLMALCRACPALVLLTLVTVLYAFLTSLLPSVQS